ncbi:sugar isomerase [Petrotoga mexicana DSM 14811]|uniref:Sugar isomerase n=1 Tax=Petrotoga mexicana DSM 14811 TaxID=1122954 RepID=A0A2K1PCG5_9BACT|nr:SIS domain-containing protein [Petrotoga mexicana]PNS00479.1 sugar isomerase [Petrotoga mexicana DSM 14811]
MNHYHLKKQLIALEKIEENIDYDTLDTLIEDMLVTINTGGKIIATALGKNVPICEKFIGTLNSLGINGHFLHTNSAIHGDLGVVKDNDLVIMLTKSGETSESIYLYEQLKKRKIKLWLLTYNGNSTLGKKIANKLVLFLEHEGDKWNLVPNNSSIGYLLVLQAVAMEITDRLDIKLEVFKQNHPGGYIGKVLETKRRV